MKLIVQTWSSDPEYNAGFDYALIDLTPELARHLVVMMEWCTMLKEQNDKLEEIVLNEGGDVRWFEDSDALGVLVDAETGKGFGTQVNESPQVFRCDAHVEIPEQWERHVDLERLIVEPNSVSWMCWPRHAEIRVYTVEVPRAVIERYILPEELLG